MMGTSKFGDHFNQTLWGKASSEAIQKRRFEILVGMSALTVQNRFPKDFRGSGGEHTVNVRRLQDGANLFLATAHQLKNQHFF